MKSGEEGQIWWAGHDSQRKGWVAVQGADAFPGPLCVLLLSLLVSSWHLWNILKLNAPFSLKWVWNEFLFFSPRRIRTPSYSQISRPIANHRISGKGQKTWRTRKESRYSAAAKPFGSQENERSHQVSLWSHFMKNSGFREGGIYFLLVLCVWPQNSS